MLVGKLSISIGKIDWTLKRAKITRIKIMVTRKNITKQKNLRQINWR